MKNLFNPIYCVNNALIIPDVALYNLHAFELVVMWPFFLASENAHRDTTAEKALYEMSPNKSCCSCYQSCHRILQLDSCGGFDVS